MSAADPTGGGPPSGTSSAPGAAPAWTGRLGAWFSPAVEGLDLGSLTIAVVASAVLLLSRFEGNVRAFHRLFGDALEALPLQPLQPHLYWFGASVLLFLVVPLATIALLPGERIRAYGVGLGDVRSGLVVSGLFFAVMLPIVVVAARHPAFSGTYPLDEDALASVGGFLVYELGYFSYFVGWEFLFRGFLLFGMAKRIGNHALWVQLLPFVLMHTGKPEAEAFGSIVAGLALGVLALRTRSFWWGAFLHGAVAVTMDLAAAWAAWGAGPG